MAANTTAKLVSMANQIASFFATQPGDTQAAEVAGHLKAFWEPRMLQALYAHVDADSEGRSPLVLTALEWLRAPVA